MLKFKNFRGKIQEASLKFIIPEDIPVKERNAFMGAAAAAHKAGKSHFDFGGKKHKVTMQGSTARSINSGVTEGYMPSHGDEMKKKMMTTSDKDKLVKIKQMLDREKKPVKKEAKHNNKKKEENPVIKMNPKQDEVDEAFRMRKKTGPFNDKVKTDAQKMAKHPMYKGNNSKLERDIRKKHGDKNADHFVIQNIIRKHAEMHEDLNQKDVKTVKKVAGGVAKGKPGMKAFRAGKTPYQMRIKKITGTQKETVKQNPKITVLKKGDPRIKAIQTVQAKKKKAFSDLAKKETKIDEISKKKAQRYLGYASRDMFNLGKRDQRASDIDRLGGSHPDQDYKKGPERKAAMRLRGIDRASKILMKNKKKKVSNEAFEKGQTVKPSKGPHAGQPHTVIHDFGDGHYNIKPKGLTGSRIKYRMGAAKAHKKDLQKHESKLNELSPKTLSNYARGAAMDMGTKNYVRGFEKGQSMMGMKRKEDPKDKKKAQNRLTGIITATDKLRRKTNEDQHDDDGANHIVMQLRKAVTLRGMRPVTFKDGKKVRVEPSHAQKFLTKYNKAKPMDKEKMQAMAHKSHDHFKKSLGEDVDEGVLGGIAKAAGYASGVLPAYHAARLAGKGIGKMANAALRVKKSDGTRGAIRGTRAASLQKSQRKTDYYKKQDKLNKDLERERRNKRQAKSDFRQSKPSLGQRIGGVFASKQPSNEKR